MTHFLKEKESGDRSVAEKCTDRFALTLTVNPARKIIFDLVTGSVRGKKRKKPPRQGLQ